MEATSSTSTILGLEKDGLNDIQWLHNSHTHTHIYIFFFIHIFVLTFTITHLYILYTNSLASFLFALAKLLTVTGSVELSS